VIENEQNFQSKQKQQEIVKTELDKAYEFLGVNRNLTMQEINKIRRNLQSKYHPDKNPNNRAYYENYSKKINSAFDLIKKSRG